MKAFLRRIFLVVVWPFIDLILTVFANLMLVRFGVWRATIASGVVAALVNLGFLQLLYFEQGTQRWIKKKVQTRLFIKLRGLSTHIGKTAVVLLTYAITGPAMVGTPLVWLLGIPKRRAYVLVTVGLVVNAILWVGGVFNILWMILHHPVIF